MCFSPQRRAFFRHQNIKKCSKHLMFWAFSRPHLRFATAVCHFSTSERTKVLQTPHVLCIFISTCAFRHSGVHFSTGEEQKVLRSWRVCTFSLQNVLFASAASNFSTSDLQEVLRTRQFFKHFHFKMCFSPQRCAIFDVSSQHLPPHPPL